MHKETQQYLKEIGKKGGQSRSPKKLKAIALNAKKYDMKLSKRELETLQTCIGTVLSVIPYTTIHPSQYDIHARAQALRDKITKALEN
jgi:hypothetical protein